MTKTERAATLSLTSIPGVTFAELLQALRLAHGSNRHQFAKYVGLKERTIRQLEKGCRAPEVGEVMVIVAAFNLPIEPFLTVSLQDMVNSAELPWNFKVRLTSLKKDGKA